MVMKDKNNIIEEYRKIKSDFILSKKLNNEGIKEMEYLLELYHITSCELCINKVDIL